MEEKQMQSNERIRRSESKKHNYDVLSMGLFLVLGILVGFSVKTEASKRVTMGFGDYLLSQRDAGAYDINAIQKDLLAKGEVGGLASPQAAGSSCGQ
jgi:hypothetical protein